MTRSATAVSVLAVLLAACAAASTLIVPGTRVGPVTAASSEAELVARFGPARVTPARIEIGEGFTCEGARVAVDDGHTLELIWRDGPARAGVSEIVVDGPRWRTAEGIRLGLTLSELEAINGGPFELSGFGWDYGGTVGSWHGGRLAAVPEAGGLIIRLNPARARLNLLSDAEQRAVSGDKTLPSDHPVMRELDPTVVELRVRFDAAPCDAAFTG